LYEGRGGFLEKQVLEGRALRLVSAKTTRTERSEVPQRRCVNFVSVDRREERGAIHARSVNVSQGRAPVGRPLDALGGISAKHL
jgi:hypothetical protein